MSIYIFEATDIDKRYLTDNLPGEILHFMEQPLTNVEQAGKIAKDAEILSVFVHSHVGSDVINALPNLQMIATRSTGFDHINLPAAASRAIPVCNVPTYGENTVAEHCFALILSLSRNLHRATKQAAEGDFTIDGLKGFDLKGKTIGVVGVGHIGLHVVRIAKGFGMNVLAYDPVPNPIAAEVLGFAYVTSLGELLNHSDIVTLHAPLTQGTHHLIGEHNIGQFKHGALLINTARGALVDTCALIQALDDGNLRGAGLDVIEGEEIFSEEKQLLGVVESGTEERLRMALRNVSLVKRADVIITPHIAFDSSEAIERILKTTADNIRTFRNGIPSNTVHT